MTEFNEMNKLLQQLAALDPTNSEHILSIRTKCLDEFVKLRSELELLRTTYKNSNLNGWGREGF